mmetsp:Transcript_6212/g.9131  ORF Transcript_6212/g.9131 Transcript_6212/m.9131 type:complete len:102 (-) Transcript_6212:55-360(-)
MNALISTSTNESAGHQRLKAHTKVTHEWITAVVTHKNTSMPHVILNAMFLSLFRQQRSQKNQRRADVSCRNNCCPCNGSRFSSLSELLRVYLPPTTDESSS